MNIHHDAYVLLADGARAVLARNVGTALQPRLEMRSDFHGEIPPTRDLGSDRPGRAFESTSARRSAYEQANWHEQAEEKFLGKVAHRLEELCRSEHVRHLLIVAAPRTLGILREKLPDTVRRKVDAEIDKDFTGQPLAEVERRLAAL
jgi:protein required for attachment to host cells